MDHRFLICQKAVEKSGKLTLGYVGRFPFVSGQMIQSSHNVGPLELVNAIITASDEVSLKELALSLKVDDFIDFIGLVDKEETSVF